MGMVIGRMAQSIGPSPNKTRSAGGSRDFGDNSTEGASLPAARRTNIRRRLVRELADLEQMQPNSVVLRRSARLRSVSVASRGAASGSVGIRRSLRQNPSLVSATNNSRLSTTPASASGAGRARTGGSSAARVGGRRSISSTRRRSSSISGGGLRRSARLRAISGTGSQQTGSLRRRGLIGRAH